MASISDALTQISNMVLFGSYVGLKRSPDGEEGRFTHWPSLQFNHHDIIAGPSVCLKTHEFGI